MNFASPFPNKRRNDVSPATVQRNLFGGRSNRRNGASTSTASMSYNYSSTNHGARAHSVPSTPRARYSFVLQAAVASPTPDALGAGACQQLKHGASYVALATESFGYSIADSSKNISDAFVVLADCPASKGIKHAGQGVRLMGEAANTSLPNFSWAISIAAFLYGAAAVISSLSSLSSLAPLPALLRDMASLWSDYNLLGAVVATLFCVCSAALGASIISATIFICSRLWNASFPAQARARRQEYNR